MTCKEELIWGDAEHAWLPRGHLQTRGPGEYHVPPVIKPDHIAIFLSNGDDGGKFPQRLEHAG